MHRIGIVALGLGCVQPEPTGVTEPQAPTADTASPSLVVKADCLLTANVLRAQCTVDLAEPRGVRLTYVPEDGSLPARVVDSPELVDSHTFLLTMMKQDAPYAVTAMVSGERAGPPWRGSLRTGIAPEGAQTRLVGATGQPTLPLVGLSSACAEGAFAVVLSTSGELVWYHDFATGTSAALDAVSFTDERTVLAIIDGGVREVDLAGEVLLDVEGSTLGRRLHHDVFRRDGRTWVLYNALFPTEEANFLLDGFLVLDADGKVETDWFLGDHHTPDAGAGTGLVLDDYSHANSVWADASHDVLLSLRHQSAVLKVAGSGERTGEVLWRLVGHPNSAFEGDFVLDDQTGGHDTFAQQHNAHLLPDGRLAIFDNRFGSPQSSRVVVMDLDEAGGVARIEEAYDLSQSCPFQGSAYHTATGNPLAGCAGARQVTELAAGVLNGTTEPEPPLWSARADCDSDQHQFVPRFFPLDEW
ncbi:MAG: aryl-sulfate sulfotransferase [Myxococcales bacterium]|nr:aryl-sulfate sulfotransferase [Myxococcales bacterium]